MTGTFAAVRTALKGSVEAWKGYDKAVHKLHSRRTTACGLPMCPKSPRLSKLVVATAGPGETGQTALSGECCHVRGSPHSFCSVQSLLSTVLGPLLVPCNAATIGSLRQVDHSAQTLSLNSALQTLQVAWSTYRAKKDSVR